MISNPFQALHNGGTHIAIGISCMDQKVGISMENASIFNEEPLISSHPHANNPLKKHTKKGFIHLLKLTSNTWKLFSNKHLAPWK